MCVKILQKSVNYEFIKLEDLKVSKPSTNKWLIVSFCQSITVSDFSRTVKKVVIAFCAVISYFDLDSVIVQSMSPRPPKRQNRQNITNIK